MNATEHIKRSKMGGDEVYLSPKGETKAND